MSVRHQAIRNIVKIKCHIVNDNVFDVSGENVDYDSALVDAEMSRLQAAEPIRLLRVERDKLLAESDWTGLADSAITSEVSAQWKLYRQRLRDLPAGLNTPAKVKNAKWPTKPV